MLPMKEQDIGGALVRRYIRRGDLPPLLAGTRLTREEVLAFPPRNRMALVQSERITLFPSGDGASAEPSERHIAHVGGGRFNVIAGHKINDEPLSRAEADELAGQRSN